MLPDDYVERSLAVLLPRWRWMKRSTVGYTVRSLAHELGVAVAEHRTRDALYLTFRGSRRVVNDLVMAVRCHCDEEGILTAVREEV